MEGAWVSLLLLNPFSIFVGLRLIRIVLFVIIKAMERKLKIPPDQQMPWGGS